MKKSLTGPDIRELVADWQILVGSRVDQFGRPDSNKLVIKLRNRDLGTVRLILDLGGWAYLTKDSATTESNQGAFVNIVRQRIKKGRLDSITQLNGDRIICFDFSRKDEKIRLILEFFHKGNAILCNGQKIEMVMRQQKFRHRNLLPNENYVSPPGFNPFTSSVEDYGLRLSNSERSLGASLTIDCNLGGEISNLICHKLNVDPNSKYTNDSLDDIFSTTKNILDSKFKPTIFLDEEGNSFTVSKFNLSNLAPGNNYPTFDNAIEEYLKKTKKPEVVKKSKDRIRIDHQKAAIEKFNKQAIEHRRIGQLIFDNILDVDSKMQASEDSEIFIDIEGISISIDTSKSAQANASLYFDKAKEFERKAERTEQIIRERPQSSPKKKVNVRKLDWFEKYRWFITSEGFIAIAGKDATTNEQVVKKYLKTNDRYAHADIHGAPSVVVKSNQGISPTVKSMEQASSFSLAYSKAWGARVASGHSYWVEEDSVSKTPNTGEFLAKGAFVIRGKRNWHKNVEVKLAIGLITYEGNEKLMAGPIEAFVGLSKKYVIFKPGFIDRKITSRTVAQAFNDELSLVDKLLPNGGFDLVDSHGIEINFG